MNAKSNLLRFLTDHNVPDSVGNELIDLGHDVVKVREVMPADSADPVVAKAAMEDGRILISWDRDFGQQRFKSPRFADLSRLAMSCPEPDGVKRIVETIDLILFAVQRVHPNSIVVRVGIDKVVIHS